MPESKMVKLLIRHDKEWDDWIVKWYDGRTLNERKSYHAYRDKQDAIATMHQMYFEGIKRGLSIQQDPLYS